MRILFLFLFFKLIIYYFIKAEIEVYRKEDFHKSKVGIHIPCQESNEFSTKCWCFIKCTDAECENAKNICKKYELR